MSKEYFKTIYLIRHGETFHNRDGSGKKNLTPEGVAHSKLVLPFFSNKFISNVYCSTMPRAIESTKPLEKQFNLVAKKDSVFCEIQGNLIGHKVLFSLSMTIKDRLRINRAWKIISEIEDNSVIVCHGNFIRAMLAKALHLNLKSFSNFLIPNCSITTLRLTKFGWYIESIYPTKEILFKAI